MNTSFDTTVWVVQSMLILFGLIAVLPLVRAIVGLSLIALAHLFGTRNVILYQSGVRTLPPFLRATLGLTTALSIGTGLVAQPAMADETLIIDRVVTVVNAESNVDDAPPVEVVEPKAIAEELVAPQSVAKKTGVYTVQPGDSLWKIANDLLAINNLTVTSPMIDEEWRALWRANRATIGSDPSRIIPGQQLKLDYDRPTNS